MNIIRKFTKNSQTSAWILYDWANSAFATAVLAGFFPIFFKLYWSAGIDVSVSTYRLGLANGMASLCLAILAPFLGVVADLRDWTHRFLIGFSLLGIGATFCLGFVPKYAWMMATIVFILGTIGFSGSTIFYDALLPRISTEKTADKISAMGYGFGYLGGGLAFVICVAMTQAPALFRLDNEISAIKISFIVVAAWWALFGLPLFLSRRKRRRETLPGHIFSLVKQQLQEMAIRLRHHPKIALFLLAYWCYIDGVYTVIRMAVDYGLSLGFSSSTMIISLLITQFVGFPSAIAFGILGQRFGAIKGLYVGIVGYILVLVLAMTLKTATMFYVLAACIGMVQGGLQALSRSYFSSLIPAGESTSYFGIYNMVGKFSAIMGPFIMAFVVFVLRQWTQDAMLSARLSILSIAVLFVLGAWVLRLSQIRR